MSQSTGLVRRGSAGGRRHVRMCGSRGQRSHRSRSSKIPGRHGRRRWRLCRVMRGRRPVRRSVANNRGALCVDYGRLGRRTDFVNAFVAPTRGSGNGGPSGKRHAGAGFGSGGRSGRQGYRGSQKLGLRLCLYEFGFRCLGRQLGRVRNCRSCRRFLFYPPTVAMGALRSRPTTRDRSICRNLRGLRRGRRRL